MNDFVDEFLRLVRESLDRQHEEQERGEIARLWSIIESLSEPIRPSWERLTLVAARGDHEYLVRAANGSYVVDVDVRRAYPVHEVRTLTGGGWQPAEQGSPGEAVALQVVARTLAPWLFAGPGGGAA